MAGNRKIRALISARGVSSKAGEQTLRDAGFRDPTSSLAAVQRLFRDDIQRQALSAVFERLMESCARSADPDRALVNFERLVEALPNPGMFYHYLESAPDRLDLLAKIFAHSQALSDTLARNATFFHFLIAPETLSRPRDKKWMDAELRRLLMPVRLSEERYDVIRRFRRRETLRIGARDLTGKAVVEETTLELSNLADVCLQLVYETAMDELCAQHNLTGEERGRLRFAVMGMGKLGGQELNYSSDIDVVFVYDEDGEVRRNLSRHDFFKKLAEEIIRRVGEATDEGSIFRIDLRLRPEGKSGPLVRALDGYENYYAQWGEMWERMAFIKARCVAGDMVLGDEFLAMVRPFVYSRHAGGDIIRQMSVLKKRIEDEIVREDRLTRHVKLGVGGIREIEFIVQSFQVLMGARQPALRQRSTLKTLPALVAAKVLTEEDAQTLAEAYRFLRNVEHRLQMEMELQTHTIPDEEQALYRLARSMDFASVEEFQSRQSWHTSEVRRIYSAVLADAVDRAGGDPLLSPEKLPGALEAAGFADVPEAMKTVDRLVHGPGFGHVSQRTQELFGSVFPTVLEWARKVAEPDKALARLEKFTNAYGSRGLLYEVLASHPRLVEMLMRLGDASGFLSETIVRQPELFDEVCRGVTLNEPKSRERLLEEVRTLAEKSDEPMEQARRWKQAELLRIGLEDVLELVDLEQLHHEITWLAGSCLRFSVEMARRDLKMEKFPFAVIAMGKYGGQELGYGADLDVLFVGGRDGSDQAQACRLAAAVMRLMTEQTAAGTLFPVDPRLRPDGEKGPVASSLSAHRDYYRERAMLWERQALTKARWVAGEETLGRKFMVLAHEAAFERGLSDEELGQIVKMRHRIETERGDQAHREWEFKTGPGGLVDVEFLVQAMQMRHGRDHESVRTSHTLSALNRLTAAGIVEDELSYDLRRGYLFLRKIESVLRRMENTSVSRLPAGEKDRLALARRMGFASLPDFERAYAGMTGRIRAAYRHVMSC